MSSSVCGCLGCPSGIALQYLVTIAGLKNLSPPYCEHCADANATYLMNIETGGLPCSYVANLAVCGTATIHLQFTPDGAGYTAAAVAFASTITTSFALTGLPDCLTPFVAPMIGNGPICDATGATATVVPVPLTTAQLAAAT